MLLTDQGQCEGEVCGLTTACCLCAMKVASTEYMLKYAKLKKAKNLNDLTGQRRGHDFLPVLLMLSLCVRGCKSNCEAESTAHSSTMK